MCFISLLQSYTFGNLSLTQQDVNTSWIKPYFQHQQFKLLLYDIPVQLVQPNHSNAFG